ncbi:hypothetical protein AVEN_93634-1 [Araneus ventricosus]|uniref:Uncharacterized protein n=1 Tax=Araneus ventricosus TaxID=182803 RepID=A0A4Y2IBS6_ARAVE|nr:hypothetical protein AVEN_193893-1 [Araneus ventricosus]GBM75216.1 hypothetical protein AVEN_147302-1 [Araneus ventricosus]GBM76354.1 hypothetical protein AVEN_62592-1 [Araneus ventricosus]GBM76357.1 hypothetical protein AVEN_93634-1 [Araneus ventricosus]
MINKSHATADEEYQLKGSNSDQARWLSSVLPQRLIHHRCGLTYAACTHSSPSSSTPLSLLLSPPPLSPPTPLLLGLGLVWSDGNEEGTPIYTWMNSARAELHVISILHGRIKFHQPPHGKVRDENAKIREPTTF